MASIIKSLLRLVRSGKRHRDEEQADSLKGSSTFPPTTQQRISPEDALALFRLALGITATPHLGFASSSLRPADNLGLYARVVHSERTAKANYKLFSVVINVCYFMQIIVAASVTAMGAANANNKAITAFGAINTIVAGFLAYLQGSGYPARLKYYAGEWKKVREYIEHRERDFSLEGGCGLDVGAVVEEVREMYERTKREIELNTPDNYTSVSRSAAEMSAMRVQGVDVAKAQAIAGKFRGLDDTVRKMKGHVGDMPRNGEDVVGKLRALGGAVQNLRGDVSEGVEAELRGMGDALEKEVAIRVDKAVDDGRDAAYEAIRDEEKRALAGLRGLGKAVVREVEEHRPRPLREVSITPGHRGGHDQGGEIEATQRKSHL
jgi:hypothetical protein